MVIEEHASAVKGGGYRFMHSPLGLQISEES